jgi:glycosyltransferase involved in cell wall biosynthesis
MRICIDGLGISRLHGTGLYSYTYELLDSLLDIYPQPRYKVIWEGPSRISSWQRYRNLSYEELLLNRRENDYSALEEYLADNKIDLYHCPNNGFSLPANKAAKYIITVHDLFPVAHGKLTDPVYLEKFKAVFPAAVKNSDKIIAVSHFVKKELLRYFEIPQGKIQVVYPGCSSRFRHISLDECRTAVKEKYGIEGDFVLYAGSIHERKNLTLLIRAFKKTLPQADGLNLVIAGKTDGKRHQYFLKLKNLANQLGITNSVIFTGTVDYNDMPNLYNASRCAVNLSIYEGFPRTTIEAMACGTPVICMHSPAEDDSSFGETAGSGASYINFSDEDGLTDLMLKIILNRSYRKDMSEKGRHQSKKFSSSTFARAMVSVYESAAYDSI